MSDREWQHRLQAANQALQTAERAVMTGRQELNMLEQLLDSVSQGLPETAVVENHRLRVLLEEQRLRADSANRAKSEFLANMSHEIRTPLTAITGYAELLSMPDQRSPQDVIWAQQILRSVKHLGMLLDDILDLSRVEAGRLTVELKPVDLIGITNEIAELFRPQAEEMLLDFSVEIEPNLPQEVQADAARLRQVLMNLVSNAVKFTERGEVKVQVSRVRLKAQSANPGNHNSAKEELHFRISDTGVGMTREQITQLFRPFQRLHGESLVIPGTGLGLAISQRLVELMEGRITVESQPGLGSCFTLALPLVAADDGMSEITSNTGSVVNSVPVKRRRESELRGVRLLIAEDNPVNVSILTHFLKPNRMQVTVAVNGQEAIQAVMDRFQTPEAFDLILMDMQMPIMNGYEATAKLRENGVQIPIIACSAFALESDVERSRKAGCNSIVTKPIIRQNLVEALVAACPSRSAGLQRPNAGEAQSGPNVASKPEPFGKFTSAVPLATAVPSSVTEAPTQNKGFAALVERYRVSLANQLQTIEAAELRNDPDEVSTIAHRLSGTAGNYGFPEITKLAAACETKLRKGCTLEQIHPELSQLKQRIADAATKP